MRIIKTEFLYRHGQFSESTQMQSILDTVREAILSVKWPANSTSFSLFPCKHKNGVKPIKNSCMNHLRNNGWELEKSLQLGTRIRPGKVDAIKIISPDVYFALEWETGNISSSHRALNKICIGLLNNVLVGGILILPSRSMYKHLTDRVGNFAELEPYFQVWQNLMHLANGVIIVIEVEHDSLNENVPLIPKGTDGRALR